MTLISTFRFWSKSNVNMSVDSPHITIYDSNSDVQLTVTICRVFSVKMCNVLVLDFDTQTGSRKKYKYTNRKAIYDIIFHDNGHISPIFHHFQDICNRNVHDLDLDRQNWSRPNVNMTMESMRMTCYSWQYKLHHICRYFQDIHCRNVLDLDFDLQTRPRQNVNMPIESPCMTFHLTTIASSAISVIICAIICMNLRNIVDFNIQL